MFQLVLKSIGDNRLLNGIIENITLNNNSLHDRLYYEAGRIMALSLVHGGSSPNFFAETLFSLLVYGTESTLPTLNDIYSVVQETLNTLKNATELHYHVRQYFF